MSLWAQPPELPEPLARAYAACERLAQSHYENFPVASRLLPAAMRPHIAAVYAFARIADDFADEGSASATERQARLRDWQQRLHRAVSSIPQASQVSQASPMPAARHTTADTPDPPPGTTPGAADPAGAEYDRLFLAIAHTIRTRDLPVSLFDDLLSAFAQDTTTPRYGSWDDLLDYCRRSANPVGRLVLRIAGLVDARLDRSSDALCTALQLTNFWQDFGRDWHAGRLYVPRAVWLQTGASERDLDAGRMTEAWTRAIARCVDETRRFYRDGRTVCDGVHGRLRIELRVTWLGGHRILDRVEAGRHALLRTRPRLGRRDVPALLWQVVRWQRQVA